MISRMPLLAMLLALSTVTFSMAFAAIQPQILLTNAGSSEIDLVWEHKDRFVRTLAGFSNFNPNDGSFLMQIIQSETGKIVSESTINVMTNSQNPTVSFNTYVLYAVHAEDICQNEEFDASQVSIEECSPLTGQYEMMISIKDGTIVESIPFTIVDTRN